MFSEIKIKYFGESLIILRFLLLLDFFFNFVLFYLTCKAVIIVSEDSLNKKLVEGNVGNGETI